jgi:hypothetical protein
MELDGHAQRAASALEYGDGEAVQADIAAHARLAEELPVAIHRWAATTMGVLQALLRGSFDEAGVVLFSPAGHLDRAVGGRYRPFRHRVGCS